MGRLGHISSTRPLRRELFPGGFAGEVMQLILDTWHEFSLRREVRLETRITAVFRQSLIDAYVAADRSWFITLEDPLVDPDFGTEEGRNDLNFFPPRHYGQTVFFTVECKRLHVTTDSGFKYLTTDYVNDGVKRFVSGQYSSGLPCGGMVGYVMDNRVDLAFSNVQQEIATCSQELKGPADAPIWKVSSLLPTYQYCAETVHHRPDGEFILHHVFVGVRHLPQTANNGNEKDFAQIS